MKTLDEVIKGVEAYRNYFSVNGCFECHYREDDCVKSCFLEDALQYLKWYKDLADDSEAFAAWKENPPLTWEELKDMEGKPVWIEADNGQEQFKHWFIIDDFTMSDIPGLQIMWCLYQSFRFWEADLGKTWQAFRKERNNADEA